MARILVIDDEDALRAMLKKALEKQGHEVLEATSGAEGVRVYQERTVDLVMTDMFMPGSGGLGCILELRQLDPAARIIAMTGGGLSADLLEEASRLGADRTFSKPFELTEVVSAVEEELKKRHAA